MQEPGRICIARDCQRGSLRPFRDRSRAWLDGTVRQPGHGEGLPQPRPVLAGAGPGRSGAWRGRSRAARAAAGLPEDG